MKKILAVLGLITMSSTAVAKDVSVLEQLCETFNAHVPQIVTLYQQGTYPHEIKKTLNPAFVKGFPNLGNKELSIIIQMSNGIVDYSFLKYNDGYPASLIQSDISSNICSKFANIT